MSFAIPGFELKPDAPELLFIKAILDGYALAQKSPKYVTDAVDLYGEAWGDTTLSETRERIIEMLNSAR